MLVKHFFNELRQVGRAIDLRGLDGLINSESNWLWERTLIRSLSTVQLASLCEHRVGEALPVRRWGPRRLRTVALARHPADLRKETC
jgi:hypothetical protein